MRLRIHHETRYVYDVPPVWAIELLRLTPSNTDTQSVREWRIVVSGDAPLRRFDDAFGNVSHTFTTDALKDGLVVTATGTVETGGTSGVIAGAREPLPVGVFLRETPLTAPTAAIAVLGNEARARSDGTALDFAHALNRLVNTRVAFREGRTDARTTAGEALAAGSGVCQDLAHVLIASARAAGVPARYVSGYQFAHGRARDAHAGHAWAELFVPGLGWVGFDPTAGMSTDETYVRVAVGLDFLGASPIRGAVYGGSGETLDVNVDLDDGSARWRTESRQQATQSQSRGQE